MLVTSDGFGDESRDVRHLLFNSLGSDEKLERMEARYCTACPAAPTTETGECRNRTTRSCTNQVIPL